MTTKEYEAKYGRLNTHPDNPLGNDESFALVSVVGSFMFVLATIIFLILIYS
jgi:hypothetical protein